MCQQLVLRKGPQEVFLATSPAVIVPTLTYYIGASLNLACLWLCWRFPRRKGAQEVRLLFIAPRQSGKHPPVACRACTQCTLMIATHPHVKPCPNLQQAADGEPSAAVQAGRTASFAAPDIRGGSAFAHPSGVSEARTPQALEVEGSAYSATVPNSALRSRSLMSYLPGSPAASERLPSGALWLQFIDEGRSAGTAGHEEGEGGERLPATPPTTPMVRTPHGLIGV